MPGLGRKIRNVAKHAAGQSYEDVEGITISLGVIFALLLPASMALQYLAHDEKVQERNFFLLLCTEPDFRTFVIDTMEDSNLGDVGTYEHEMFNFVAPIGDGKTIDMKQVLQDQSHWVTVKKPESVYECATNKEAVTTAHLLVEGFPMRRMGAWALMHPDSVLWSDHLHAMCSFCMSTLKAGLLGSLLLYISLSASPSRDGEGGPKAVQAWATIGVPAILVNFCCLLGAVVCLLFAQDAYVESQDPFAFRAGRFGNYSKIALVAIFLPLVLLFTVGAVWSLVRSCRSQRTIVSSDEEQGNEH